jgi:hypothetical protein
MGKILWLASYPRSGNTWLRVLLHNYMRNAAEPYDINRLQDLTAIDSSARWYQMLDPRPCSALTKEEAAALRPRVHELITRSSPDTVFVKTHNALVVDRGTPMISEDHTAGAIYILRNPLDVAVSYAVHFGLSQEEAVAAMNRPHNQSISNEENFAYEFHGSWSENVESWTMRDTKAIHVVRYEDLQQSPQILRRHRAFLGCREPGADRAGDPQQRFRNPAGARAQIRISRTQSKIRPLLPHRPCR